MDHASSELVKACRNVLPDLEKSLCPRIIDISKIETAAYQVLVRHCALSETQNQQLHYVGTGDRSSISTASTAHFFVQMLETVNSAGAVGSDNASLELMPLTLSQHRLVSTVIKFLCDFSDATKQNILQSDELRKCRMIPVFGKDMQSYFLACPETVSIVENSSWSPSMVTILQQANVYILDEGVSAHENCIKYLCDAQLVSRARPANILKVLVRSKGSKENLGQYVCQFNNQVKSQLGEYFFSITSYMDHSRKPMPISEEVVDILRCLPLLRVHQQGERSKYASANEEDLVLPQPGS